MELTMEEKRAEWLKLMTELADRDREAYREARADAWGRVASGHTHKTPQQIAEWRENAS